MEYKFTKYLPLHLPSLTKLLVQAFAIENKDKEGLIKWKYFDPYFKQESVTYLALDKDNNVVGHYSSMPIPIQYGDKTYKVTLSTDAATDTLHRGKGIMSKLSALLYKEVAGKGHDFSLGYPNDIGVVMDKYSKNYGYQLVGKFARYFTFVIYRKKVPYKLSKTQTIKGLPLTSFQHKDFFTMRKDVQYLTWRYTNKPNEPYDIYKIQGEEGSLGYVVLRFLAGKCYVYDIITGNHDPLHMRKILKSIENKALDHSTRMVIYYVLDNEYWKRLFGFGYFRKEKSQVNYYFSIHLHNKNVDSGVLNKDRWLLMNGDIL